MRCTHCDSRVTKKNKFCPECGVPVVWEESDLLREKGKRNGIVILVLGALLLAAVVIIVVLLAGGNKSGQMLPVETQLVISDQGFVDNPAAISAASRSVVKLNCYNSKGALLCTGSGFAAFEEGVIVTNYHVIEDKPSRVEMVMESGQKCDLAGVVGASKERDIAILYYQTRDAKFELPILALCLRQMLQKGEKVVAIGSPLGLMNVVSTGVVSGYSEASGHTDIQFTASISSGSSGGALFNDKGEVVGITYASYDAGQNLNLAVPIDFVESVWQTNKRTRSSFPNFYDSLIPHYTVDYVMKHYKDLKNTEFYLDYWASSYGKNASGSFIAYVAADYNDIYDPNQNKPEVRYQKDAERYRTSALLKVVYNQLYWGSDSDMEFNFGKRSKQHSIKCSGVEWSATDQKPYVVYPGPKLISFK